MTNVKNIPSTTEAPQSSQPAIAKKNEIFTRNYVEVGLRLGLKLEFKILLEIAFLKKRELLDLTKRCSKACSLFHIFTKPDLVHLPWLRTIGNPAFWTSVALEKDHLQNFCRISNGMLVNYQPSRCLFCQKLSKVILFWCNENAKHRIANDTKSNGLHLIFADEENTDTRFRTPLYYLK